MFVCTDNPTFMMELIKDKAVKNMHRQSHIYDGIDQR
jgi:hypothetical protein